MTKNKEMQISYLKELIKELEKSHNEEHTRNIMNLAQMDNQIILKNSHNKQRNSRDVKREQLQKDITNMTRELSIIKGLRNDYNTKIGLLLKDIKDRKFIYEYQKARLTLSNHYDSLLITSEKKFRLISQWITEENTVKLKLLYRGSNHNFSTKTFHEVCDKSTIKNTLTLIQLDDDSIVGGFTYNNWSGNGFTEDNYAFIFSLDQERFYRVKQGLEAIYPYKEYFVVFGRGDLVIMNKDKCATSFPNNYGPCDQYFGLTNGRIEFKIKEIEVFTVTNI